MKDSTERQRTPINETSERLRVVEIAHEWLNTPWHHFGQVKGSGVDCAMLLKCVYEEAIPDLNIPVEFYPQQWHLHENVERFKSIVESYCAEVIDDIVVPGDIVLCHLGRVYSHGLIVVSYDGMCIHASLADRCVVLASMNIDSHLRRCAKAFYRPKRWMNVQK